MLVGLTDTADNPSPWCATLCTPRACAAPACIPSIETFPRRTGHVAVCCTSVAATPPSPLTGRSVTIDVGLFSAQTAVALLAYYVAQHYRGQIRKTNPTQKSVIMCRY